MIRCAAYACKEPIQSPEIVCDDCWRAIPPRLRTAINRCTKELGTAEDRAEASARYVRAWGHALSRLAEERVTERLSCELMERERYVQEPGQV